MPGRTPVELQEQPEGGLCRAGLPQRPGGHRAESGEGRHPGGGLAVGGVVREDQDIRRRFRTCRSGREPEEAGGDRLEGGGHPHLPGARSPQNPLGLLGRGRFGAGPRRPEDAATDHELCVEFGTEFLEEGLLAGEGNREEHHVAVPRCHPIRRAGHREFPGFPRNRACRIRTGPHPRRGLLRPFLVAGADHHLGSAEREPPREPQSELSGPAEHCEVGSRWRNPRGVRAAMHPR